MAVGSSRSWLGALMARQFRLRRNTSLKTRYSAFSRTFSRLLALVRSRTPEKIDSIGLLVRKVHPMFGDPRNRQPPLPACLGASCGLPLAPSSRGHHPVRGQLRLAAEPDSVLSRRSLS